MASLNETSVEILTEKAFQKGTLLAGVANGVELALFLMTFWLLLRRRSNAGPRKHELIFLAYSTTIFVLEILFFALNNAQLTHLSFIDNRNVPGGHGVYEETMFAIPIDELGNVCATWFCDALLLWRFYVIFNSAGYLTVIIMIFPSLLFRVLGSFVMGLLFLLQVSASSPWSSDSSINWTIPFFALFSLNILLTIAIVLRLLFFRRKIASLLGSEYGSPYAGIAAMIVESATTFSTFSLLFLIPFAMNNPLNEVFFQALSGVQIVATLSIYLSRFKAGQSCGNETHAMQHIHFTQSNRVSGMGASRTLGGSRDELNGTSSEDGKYSVGLGKKITEDV